LATPRKPNKKRWADFNQSRRFLFEAIKARSNKPIAFRENFSYILT